MEEKIVQHEDVGATPADIAVQLADQYVADVVDVLNGLPPETAAEVLVLLPRQRAADVLDQPGLKKRPR